MGRGVRGRGLRGGGIKRLRESPTEFCKATYGEAGGATSTANRSWRLEIRGGEGRCVA